MIPFPSSRQKLRIIFYDYVIWKSSLRSLFAILHIHHFETSLPQTKEKCKSRIKTSNLITPKART